MAKKLTNKLTKTTELPEGFPARRIKRVLGKRHITIQQIIFNDKTVETSIQENSFNRIETLGLLMNMQHHILNEPASKIQTIFPKPLKIKK